MVTVKVRSIGESDFEIDGPAGTSNLEEHEESFLYIR